MIYLFLGQDPLSKDAQLHKLRQQYLPKTTQEFNLDILYAKELTLKALQEKLLFLPASAGKRLVVIRNCQDLKEEVRDFLLAYARKPYPQVILVLDAETYDRKNTFLNQILRFTKPVRFKEEVRPDTFALARQIEMRRADFALRVLNQLLSNGERPERILGGLRYAWEKEAGNALESRRRLKYLLNCDVEIKTGKLKPQFALEKMVISLCGFVPTRTK